MDEFETLQVTAALQDLLAAACGVARKLAWQKGALRKDEPSDFERKVFEQFKLEHVRLHLSDISHMLRDV